MSVGITIIFTNTPLSSRMFMIIKNSLYGICKFSGKKNCCRKHLNNKTDLLFGYNVDVKLIRMNANHKFSVYCIIKCLDLF